MAQVAQGVRLKTDYKKKKLKERRLMTLTYTTLTKIRLKACS